MKLAWSKRAKQELTEIRRYSVQKWGRDVAKRYMQDLRDAARVVAQDPDRLRDLHSGFAIMTVRSHVLVCFREDSRDILTVARVLHGAMDIDRHLPPRTEGKEE